MCVCVFIMSEIFEHRYTVHDHGVVLAHLSVIKNCPSEWCTAHIKCPHGKYTKTVGTASTQTDCEACASGFFKAHTSKNSSRTDSCTAHTKCPPGKYTEIATTTAQPVCEVCPNGLFKAFVSSNGLKSDSCVAHTKCPPGKYTIAIGSVVAQPECEACGAGFFKVHTSRNSTCVGVAAPTGMCLNRIWRL